MRWTAPTDAHGRSGWLAIGELSCTLVGSTTYTTRISIKIRAPAPPFPSRGTRSCRLAPAVQDAGKILSSSSVSLRSPLSLRCVAVVGSSVTLLYVVLTVSPIVEVQSGLVRREDHSHSRCRQPGRLTSLRCRPKASRASDGWKLAECRGDALCASATVAGYADLLHPRFVAYC